MRGQRDVDDRRVEERHPRPQYCDREHPATGGAGVGEHGETLCRGRRTRDAGKSARSAHAASCWPGRRSSPARVGRVAGVLVVGSDNAGPTLAARSRSPRLRSGPRAPVASPCPPTIPSWWSKRTPGRGASPLENLQPNRAERGTRRHQYPVRSSDEPAVDDPVAPVTWRSATRARSRSSHLARVEAAGRHARVACSHASAPVPDAADRSARRPRRAIGRRDRPRRSSRGSPDPSSAERLLSDESACRPVVDHAAVG